MARERKTWVIYPEYFDKRFSRSGCRRIPKALAINKPTIDEISDILGSYDIPNRKEKDASHPSTWYENNGRIIIAKQNISKHNFLVKLGEKLKGERS